MSSALALAAVTAVLRDLLNDGLIHHNVSGALGGGVSVSVLAPDRVVSGNEVSQLNLFLHQVTPNAGWRNQGLPSREAGNGQRLANPPLALDLHYLVSAYSGGDLHAEILLGHAMQILHETPVLTRQAIRTVLTPPPGGGDGVAKALSAAGLADQIEQIRITPELLSSEDLSKLWSATQSHLRPSAAYMASVVLIEASNPMRVPLPVLSRGTVPAGSRRDRGVTVAAGMAPPLPTLEAIAAADGRPVARLGETIELSGHQLDGLARSVLLHNERLGIAPPPLAAQPPDPARSDELIRFAIPLAAAVDLPVGIYAVAAQVQRPGEALARQTNQLALTLAPEITNLPLSVNRQADGSASVGIQFRPVLRAGQQASLIVGEQELHPQPFTGPATSTLNFVIPDAEATPAPGLLVRLRIDGIDSAVVDRTARPPVFLDKRLVIA